MSVADILISLLENLIFLTRYFSYLDSCEDWLRYEEVVLLSGIS